ncbi:MAG: GspH/FimT family pseudopilin [Nitrospirota bacterium]|mgnify:CR=1 FL=1
MNRSQSGATLIELCIALAIVAMISLLAVTDFRAEAPRRQLKEASLNLVGQLRLARQRAITEGKEMAIPPPAIRGMLPNDISIGVAKGITKTPAGRPLDEDDYDGISFLNNTPIFSPNGTVNKGAIYLKNSKNEGTAVTINFTGRVRKYRWNGKDWK